MSRRNVSSLRNDYNTSNPPRATCFSPPPSSFLSFAETSPGWMRGRILGESSPSVGRRSPSQQKQPETASKLTQRRLMSVRLLWSHSPSPSSSHFTEFSINRLPIEPRQKRVTSDARKAHSRRSRALTPLFMAAVASPVSGHVFQKT